MPPGSARLVESRSRTPPKKTARATKRKRLALFLAGLAAYGLATAYNSMRAPASSGLATVRLRTCR